MKSEEIGELREKAAKYDALLEVVKELLEVWIQGDCYEDPKEKKKIDTWITKFREATESPGDPDDELP